MRVGKLSLLLLSCLLLALTTFGTSRSHSLWLLEKEKHVLCLLFLFFFPFQQALLAEHGLLSALFAFFATNATAFAALPFSSARSHSFPFALWRYLPCSKWCVSQSLAAFW